MTSTYSDSDLFHNDLSQVGFDMCHAFNPIHYNECIQENKLPLQPLPETGIAYLIGNTKHLWPIFIDWFTKETEKTTTMVDHPIDTFAREKISSVVAQHFDDDYQLYWSCDYTPDKLVSMQWVASCSGLAYLDTTTHLTVHPKYGSWHSFRAVLVANISQQAATNKTLCGIPPRPSIQPCLLTREERNQAKLALERAIEMTDMDNICDQLHSKGPAGSTADRWIAMRDCISRGREFRFGENQLHYHYTKNADYLNKSSNEQITLSKS